MSRQDLPRHCIHKYSSISQRENHRPSTILRKIKTSNPKILTYKTPNTALTQNRLDNSTLYKADNLISTFKGWRWVWDLNPCAETRTDLAGQLPTRLGEPSNQKLCISTMF